MKKMIAKCIIAVLLCFVLFAGYGKANTISEVVSENRKEASLKSETVYASLDHEGGVEHISVVNAFSQDTLEIIDYGRYQQVINLSNDKKPKIIEDFISFQLDSSTAISTPFFYEGRLENKALPWIITIAYLLDGKPISARELAGKTGDLTLSIHIRQNPLSEVWFSERYLLQIQVPFALDKAGSIIAPDASRFIAGSHQYLSFIFLPQESQSFLVKASVRDFEMEAIELTALKINLNSISMNGYGIESIEQLLDGFQQLHLATSRLADGMKASHYAMESFDRELSTASAYALILAEGIKTFEGYMLEMSSDIPQFSEGSRHINQGLKDMSQGSGNFSSAYEEIAQGMDKMLEKKEELREIALQYLMSPSEDIQKLAFALSAILNGIEKLSMGMREINSNFSDFSKGLEELSRNYETMDQGILDLAIQVPRLEREAQPLFQGACELLESFPSLSQGASQLYQGLGDLSYGIDEIHQGQHSLMSELSPAEDWMSQLSCENEDCGARSYVDPEKNRVESVQFILRTPGIYKPVEKESKTEQKDSRNFWQRLLELFSW